MTTEPSDESVERACAAFRESLIDGNYYAMTMGNVTGRVLEDAMRSALAALAPARDGWRPIESAPRNGTRVQGLVECELEWREAEPAGLISGGWNFASDKHRVVGWRPAAPHPAARRH